MAKEEKHTEKKEIKWMGNSYRNTESKKNKGFLNL